MKESNLEPNKDICDAVMYGLGFVVIAEYFNVLSETEFFYDYWRIVECGHIPCGYKKGVFYIY